MIDEFTCSVMEVRGLFKITKLNTPTGSLHQQICSTAKRNLMKQMETAVSMVWILQI